MPNSTNNIPNPCCPVGLTGSSTVHGLALPWQQVTAMLMKRVHHSRRDWKGLFSQVVLPVVFIILAMGLGSIKSDLQHFPEMELSPALYHLGPQYSFFRSETLIDTYCLLTHTNTHTLTLYHLRPPSSGQVQDTLHCCIMGDQGQYVSSAD